MEIVDKNETTMTELRNEQVRRFLIDNIDDHPRDIVSLAVEEFGMTRQAVHRHLAKLMKDGVVKAIGTTRNKIYLLVTTEFEFEVLLADNSDEDKVWRVHVAPQLNDLPENILNICYYGFTEMFNNVIDHSEGTKAWVSVSRSARKVSLNVGDNGVGIFEKIKRRFGLDDRRHAILELSKGKLTTDPAHHSGQGIFFTSRMFDFFTIESGGLRFLHYRHKDDWLIDSGFGDLPGTSVIMSIAVNSELTPKVVFDQFTDLSTDNYDFSKTHVPLSIARYGAENLVSRSQAKRVLAGFERFKEVILDFTGVNEIGQAFADEIFRVYSRSHSEVKLLPINANEGVTRMIRRAQSALKAEGNSPPSPI